MVFRSGKRAFRTVWALGAAALSMATLTAPAQAAEVGTWVLNMNISANNTELRSIQFYFWGSGGYDKYVCFPASAGTNRNLNVSGVLDREFSVRGMSSDCSGWTELPGQRIVGRSPMHGGEIVTVNLAAR